MGKNKGAEYRGTLLVDVRLGIPSKQYQAIDSSEIVTRFTARSCRICHGSYSWFATVFKNVVTLGMADPIEHWWVVLETNKGRFYCAQVCDKDCYKLFRCSSFRECDLNGLICAGKSFDSDIWTEFRRERSVKLKEMVDWMKLKIHDPEYSTFTNNCQDFCKAMVSRYNQVVKDYGCFTITYDADHPPRRI